MQKKKILFVFVFIVLSIVFVIGAVYVYKKKFVKIPTIKPNSEEISSFDNNINYHNKKNLIFVDFDNYENKNELSEKYAYSGKYSYKVFGKNSFSAVITKPVSEMGIENFERVGFSAFVYVFDENFNKLKADLVFSIVDNDGNNVVWKGAALDPVFMTANKWIKVSGSADIDLSTIKEDFVVKAYLWNDSKTNILIDDIFVVAGKDMPYRGDTTYCDISIENGWHKTFNYPPFPFRYLQSDEINNKGSVYLINNKNGKAGQISPHTKVFSGNFYNIKNGKDKIIAVEGKKLNAYSYCDNFKTFTHDLTLNLDSNNVWQKSLIYTSCFTGMGRDEIFIVDTISGTAMLCCLDQNHKNQCSSSVGEMKLSILWEGPLLAFDNYGKKISFFSTPCFLSPSKANLLTVYTDGNWKLFDFSNNQWQVFAQSNKTVTEWVKKDYNCNVVNGKFLAKSNHEQLLSVGTTLDGKTSVYNVFTFDKNNKTLTSLNGSSNSKVYGIDTLKASHVLFGLKEINSFSLVRYNSDWRFDLKQLVFNDTTYQIQNNFDFNGYIKDHNPKYYELLRLIPGCFIHKDRTSIITICYNKTKGSGSSENDTYVNYDFLPNSLQIFTPNPTQK